MASIYYDSARKGFFDGDFALLTDDIRAIMVDLADYTPSAAHSTLADVPAGARVGITGALTGKSTTAGVFDAADATISGVSGDPTEALVLYKHTGAESAPLIVLVDGATFTPNGSDVDITWDNGANKIFAFLQAA